MDALFEWLFEALFYTVCGWIGYITVKLVTFGQVELPWGPEAESLLTEWIGVGVLIAVSVLIGGLLGR